MESELASFGMGEKMKNFDIVILVIFLRRVVNLHALLGFEYSRISHNRKDSITKHMEKSNKKMIFILLINLIKIDIQKKMAHKLLTKPSRKSLVFNDLRRGAARRAKSLIVNDLSVRFKAGIVPKKPRQGRENLDGVVSE